MGSFRRPVREKRISDTNFFCRKCKRVCDLRKFISRTPHTPPRPLKRTALLKRTWPRPPNAGQSRQRGENNVTAACPRLPSATPATRPPHEACFSHRSPRRSRWGAEAMRTFALTVALLAMVGAAYGGDDDPEPPSSGGKSLR